MKYFTGIFNRFSGFNNFLSPSIKSYSGVETKNALIHPNALKVRKIVVKQNINLEGVTKNHFHDVKVGSPGMDG